MSAQSDLIDLFQLNATFDSATRTTREIIQGSDRAQVKRQIVIVKEWKRQADPIGHEGSGIIWLEHAENGKESRVVKQILKATPTTPLQANYKQELQALGHLSKVSYKSSFKLLRQVNRFPAPRSLCTFLWMV